MLVCEIQKNAQFHKRVKKGIISSSKRGKWHLQDSTFQNFPGGRPPDPPTTLAAMQLVGQTNIRPPQNFLGGRMMILPYAYDDITLISKSSCRVTSPKSSIDTITLSVVTLAFLELRSRCSTPVVIDTDTSSTETARTFGNGSISNWVTFYSVE